MTWQVCKRNTSALWFALWQSQHTGNHWRRCALSSHRAFRIALWGGLALLLGCQDYPFETRPPLRVQARKINEVVSTVRPTDILFVIDNSGSMSEEIAELQNNIELFIGALVQSSTDFQVGIVTPDLECSVPERDCAGGVSSYSCCRRSVPMCAESDTTGDGKIDTSNCDGGRLRAAPSTGRRIFSRPLAGAEAAWVAEVVEAISSLGIQGSGYEAPLEAARRAVLCAAGHDSCVWPAVRDLNAGFVRDGADLVVVFLTDEDDCSFRETSVYHRLSIPSDPFLQQVQLCSPDECYAFYGDHLDGTQNGTPDWSDTNPPPQFFRCGEFEDVGRTTPPPEPDPVNVFVNGLVAAKDGDVRRVRAAAILGAVQNPDTTFGFESAACSSTPIGPSSNCGCWSILGSIGLAGQFYCALTEAIGQLGTPVPNNGCEAMPSNRMMSFMEDLSGRRLAAGVAPDTLVDSICRPKYDTTMLNIVFNVILNNCFEMGVSPGSADEIQVHLNSALLPRVEAGDDIDGWSWIEGSNQICLEGGLKQKRVGDQFEIFVVDSD